MLISGGIGVKAFNAQQQRHVIFKCKINSANTTSLLAIKYASSINQEHNLNR